MYKNIIFDFGGVVVDFAPKDFLMDHFMNRRAEEETYELVFGSQEWQDLDRGTITREAANKQMLEHAAEAGRIFEVQTCIDEWATMLRTKKTTVQIMRKLKAAGYRLYYLTNIPTDIMDELRHLGLGLAAEIPQRDDAPFPGCQGLDRVTEHHIADPVFLACVVPQLIHQGKAVLTVGVDRLVQTGGRDGGFQRHGDVFGALAHLGGDLGYFRLAAILLLQFLPRLH